MMAGSYRVLDASAFYAGLPFMSQERFVTTPDVFDEVRHIKKDQDALDILIQTGRLRIESAGKESTDRTVAKAKETGDYGSLSKQDISILALCLEKKSQMITDDFAVSNVAKSMHVEVSPIMTGGIRTVGRWVQYCTGCRQSFKNEPECPLCGNALRRKLLKR